MSVAVPTNQRNYKVIFSQWRHRLMTHQMWRVHGVDRDNQFSNLTATSAEISRAHFDVIPAIFPRHSCTGF